MPCRARLVPGCLIEAGFIWPLGSTGHSFTGVDAGSQAAQAPLVPSGSHKVRLISLTFVLLNGAFRRVGEGMGMASGAEGVGHVAPHLF